MYIAKNLVAHLNWLPILVTQKIASMNDGRYIFSQVTDFLPKRYFERLVEAKTDDKTQRWDLTYWNQLLVLMFGQLDFCSRLKVFEGFLIYDIKVRNFYFKFGIVD